jgi:Ni/Co efflux regulator RcnB
MSGKFESEMVSRRRAFSLLGLTVALGFAASPMVLTASDAQAEERHTDHKDHTEHRRVRHTVHHTEHHTVRRKGHEDHHEEHR